MAYFDDPAHKAQWERELAALREEKKRRMESMAARGNRTSPEPAPSDPAKLPSFEELVRQAAERYEGRILNEQKASGRTVAAHAADKPEPSTAKRGNIRERITFSQLLAEEDRRQITAGSGGGKHRTMEAGNAL